MGFWLTFFFYIGTFIVSELLRPKPNLENAKPSGLGDFQFPTSQEGRPVPIVFGTVRINGPNLIWFGDLRTEAITEKVKTGLFSSDRVTIGYKYYVGIQFGLCRGPATPDGVQGGLGRIWVDDELLRDPGSPLTFTDSGTISLDSPQFFGEDSGGISGTLRVFPGTEAQAQSSYLAGVSDIDSTLLPNYRGTSYVLLEQVYIGNAPNIRPWAFEWRRIPDGLDLATNDPGAEIINGRDANPMNALYDILTDSEWGLALTNIDEASLIAAASTLADEGNGYSRILDRDLEAVELIQEIEQQVDGFLYLDAASGDYKFRLIRESDYPSPVTDIPLFDESNIIDIEFARTTWQDTSNAVRVQYNDPDKNYQATFALAQDNANLEIQNGENVVTTRTYPGVTNGTLAAKIAQRELRAQSYPLGKGKLIADRSHYTLIPGDLIRVTWDDYNLENFFARVNRVQLGALDSNEIVYDYTQDIFEAPIQVFASSQPTKWVPPSADPVDPPNYRIFQLPAQYQDTSSYQQWGVVAQRANGLQTALDVYTAEFFSGSPSESDFTFEARLSPYTPTGALVGSLSCAPESPGSAADYTDDTIRIDNTTDIGLVNLTASISQLNDTSPPNLALIDDEIIFFESITNEGSGVYRLNNVRRGMLDTVPADHDDNARVWFFTYGMAVLEPTSVADGSDFYTRLVPVSTGGEAALTRSPLLQDQHTQDNRYEGPAPARAPSIGGDVFCNLSELSGGSFTINWLVRPNEIDTDRSLVQDNSASNTTTPGDVTYQIRVYNEAVSPRQEVYTASVPLLSPSTSSHSHVVSGFTASPKGSPELYRVEIWAEENGYASQRWQTPIVNRVPLSPQSPLPIPPPSPQSPQGPSPQSPQGPSPQSPQGGIPSPQSPQIPFSPEYSPSYGDVHYDDVVLLWVSNDGDSPLSDQSKYNHQMIFNGGATIDESRSPEKFDTDSLFLSDSPESYIRIPYNSAFQIGNQDFTLEFWVRWPDGVSKTNTFVAFWDASTNDASWLGRITTGGLQWLGDADGNPASGITAINTTFSPTANVWYHIAFERVGNTGYWYVDGVLNGSGSLSLTHFAADCDLYIGASLNGSGNPANLTDNLYIDSIRMTVGTARYGASPSGFTVPSRKFPTFGPTKSPLPSPLYSPEPPSIVPSPQSPQGVSPLYSPDFGDLYWDDVVLLSHFDGADGASSPPAFVDESQSNHTGNFIATAQLDTADQKFGTASLLVDGNSDYLEIPGSTDFEFGTEDFTIEFWYRHDGTTTQNGGLISLWDQSTVQRSWYFGSITTVGWRFVYYNTGGSQSVAFTELESPRFGGDGQFHHYAVQRNGSVIDFFIDGVPVNTGNFMNDIRDPVSPQVLRIGALRSNSWLYAPGAFDDVRITRGVARYVDSPQGFTPPTREYPNFGPTKSPLPSPLYSPEPLPSPNYGDPLFGDVTFLASFEGEADESQTTFTPEVGGDVSFVNNAKVESDQARFGTVSAFFDGTGDKISVPNSDGYSPGPSAGSFTAECSVRLETDQDSTFMTVWNTGTGGAASWWFAYYLGELVLYVVEGTGQYVVFNEVWDPSPKLGQWYDLALVIDDSGPSRVTRVLVDGVQLGSDDSRIDSYTINNPAGVPLTFGAYGPTNLFPMHGYIDNIRITKGAVRYADSPLGYTPPLSQPFPGSN